MSSLTTDEQLKIFYSMDRILYRILTINLRRDPSDSMHCIALLIWLERKCFRNLVYKCLLLSHSNINQFMDEVIACLNCVNTQFVSSSSSLQRNVEDIPILRYLVMEEIYVGFFFNNRSAANEGVIKVMNDVCRRVLSDLLPTRFSVIPGSHFGIAVSSNNVGRNNTNNNSLEQDRSEPNN